jgi:hypothetical protein
MVTNYRDSSTTGWVGWVFFAGCLMVLAGIFQAIAGLAAMFKDSVFVVSQNSLLVFNYRQWGVVHLILGIILMLAGGALFSGKMWARIVAVLLAALSAIANFAFIEAYPWWSLTVIILDVVVIYAVAVHGGELKEEE